MSVSSSVTVEKIGPRVFNLTLNDNNPIALTLSGFNNALGDYLTLSAYASSNTASTLNYLVA